MADLQVNKTSTKKNYDDNPLIDGQCNKIYPSVSYGGYGYMFIWFFPIHRHTYGFHLIDGAEGSKDPFSSLFKYKKEMPDHIFYDFAWSLSEYCLNRAPSLFSNTCFWHDLFHYVGHVCGENLKSKYVKGLEGLNTEICEQVNSASNIQEPTCYKRSSCSSPNSFCTSSTRRRQQTSTEMLMWHLPFNCKCV